VEKHLALLHNVSPTRFMWKNTWWPPNNFFSFDSGKEKREKRKEMPSNHHVI